MLSAELFDLLACPSCKGDISYNEAQTAITCSSCSIDYPIEEGIPVMMAKQ